MQTINISQEDMKKSIALYSKLEPMEAQKTMGVPLEAADIVWSRKLLSVIGLEEGLTTPINSAAPIKGAAGITLTLAQCPPEI